MKILLALFTPDDNLNKQFGSGKETMIPKDAVNRGFFNGKNVSIKVKSYSTSLNSTRDVELFMLANVNDVSACIVLLDTRWISLFENIRNSAFIVPFERSDVGESAKNFFQKTIAKAFRAFGHIAQRFESLDDSKLLTLPLRNFHSKDLLEVARLCSVESFFSEFNNDLGSQIAFLRKRVRPRRRSNSKTTYAVDDKKNFTSTVSSYIHSLQQAVIISLIVSLMGYFVLETLSIEGDIIMCLKQKRIRRLYRDVSTTVMDQIITWTANLT